MVGNRPTCLCAGYFAGAEVGASMLNCVAYHGGWDPVAKVATDPALCSALPLQERPAQKGLNASNGSTHHPASRCCHPGSRWPGAGSNGLLLALEVPYGTFCDNSMGGMFVPPTQMPTALDS